MEEFRQPEYASVFPEELKRRLDSGERLQLLDVREQWEFALARIEGAALAPMSDLAREMPRIDPDRETVVICHHGVRSAHVVRLLQRAGFERVANLEGGLDAYAEVDPEIPRY